MALNGTVAPARAVTILTAALRQHFMLALGSLAIALPTLAYVARESWSTEQGAHGPIVLATGLWLLFKQWPSAPPRERPSAFAVTLLFVPLLMLYFLARVTQIVEIEGYAMYALLVAALYAMVGAPVIRALWFPLFYLLFVFPPPETLVAAFTNPLKTLISVTAVDLLYGLGYPIGGAGVVIQIGQYQLLVAAACSGLNSLISLSAISLFYIYLRHKADWRYAALLICAIVPIAIFANFVRVLILILLTYHVSEEAAQSFLHNFAGLSLFVIALVSIMAIDALAMPAWERLVGRREPVQ